MFLSVLGACLSGLLIFALHVSSKGSFPKPLSAEEEKDYLKKSRKGDKDAHKKLISHNLRLVAHIVKKYGKCGIEHDDLISIGTIGLIKGIDSFNNEKNTRLATYASRCIENEILMAIRSNKRTAQEVFIFDPIDFDNEGNALSLIDILSDDTDLAEQAHISICSKKLGKVLNTVLNKREKYIIVNRYGLDGKKELTQSELASKLHISRSYVSRIEKAALNKLKDAL